MAKDTPTTTGPIFYPMGQGMQYALDNGVLLLAIPVTKDAIAAAHLSASGKTRILATTSGFVPIPGTSGVKVGLNVTAPKG